MGFDETRALCSGATCATAGPPLIDSQDDYNHHEIKSYAPKCSSAQTLPGCAQHPIHKHSVRMAYHDGLTITKPKLVCGAIKRRRETP
ncbi:unnamed protein product [Prunus armeniaca]|uniref:Uncharacterized protein n=1 Tax=Prunus armeniaca TaxID=36596 RepID=A0A6J5WTE3_PRUAR|nr:unnamed protein product [Prunus armeniaca]